MLAPLPRRCARISFDDAAWPGMSVLRVILGDQLSPDLSALADLDPRRRPDRLVVTEPSEWRVQAMVEGWAALTGRPVEVRPDDRFSATRARFAAWARGRRAWRMEHFYREMRREHAILMAGEQPAGGEWNYDAANRKRLPAGVRPPSRLRFAPDATTRAVTTSACWKDLAGR